MMDNKKNDVLVAGELKLDLILDKLVQCPVIDKKIMAAVMKYTLGNRSTVLTSSATTPGIAVPCANNFGYKTLNDLNSKSGVRSKSKLPLNRIKKVKKVILFGLRKTPDPLKRGLARCLSCFNKKNTLHYHIISQLKPNKVMLNPFYGSQLFNRRSVIKLQRIINIATILFLVSCLPASARPGSQRITLKVENAPMSKVFQEIKKQTSYTFRYAESTIKQAKKVSIDVNNSTLQEALSICFASQPLTYKIINQMVIVQPKEKVAVNSNNIITFLSPPPPIGIHGRVVNQKGEPLQNVSVVITGTNIGTTTDKDGRFNLTAPNNKNIELEISSVGYKTQHVMVDGQTEINVTLEQGITGLSDIVVVGYSTRQLSHVSSAIDVVSGKQLNDVTSNDVSSLLQGKAAGVIVSNSSGDPNKSPSVVIRGSGSISASSDPLMVVDGIIGGYADPNDVASVTILKDAAATGLYGSRASNGVIIITTKSGQVGKTRINLIATTGFANAAQGNFKVMNSQQLYDYQKSYFPADDFAALRPDSLLSVNTNWNDLAYRTGITQNYVMSASGGTEKTKFYMSGNYYKEQGTLRHTGIEAYNVRANFKHKISNKLTLDFKLNARFKDGNNDASGNYGAITGANQNMPFDNPYNPDGTIREGTEPHWIGRENDNFLHGWQYNFDRTKSEGLNGDIDLTYSIIPGLTFSTYNRATFINNRHEIYYDVRSKAGIGVGSLQKNINFEKHLITSNRLQFNKHFGQHSLNLLAVVEAQRDHEEQNTLLGNGLPPGLHVMNAAAVIIPIPIPKPGVIADNSGIIMEDVFSKGLVQADYNYNDKYFFVGSLISESSSRFGKNNRSANFYTLATSWILSNENFMKNNGVFNQLKVRASYGSTGNANIGDYQSLGLYRYSAQYDDISASIPFQLANPDLTWEKAKTVNLGLDIGVFNRISLSLDWYDKTTKDLLLNVPLAYTSGYSSVIKNIGSIKNTGFEVRLLTENIKNKNFQWETNFNIAFNKNRVLSLYQGKPINISDVNGNTSQQISVGQDMFSWYMYKWAGVDPENGDPLWEKVTTNDNGVKEITTTNNYNDATLQIVGTASPKFTGGINNTFTYRNFSLDAFFNFVSGNLVYDGQYVGADGDGAFTQYNTRVLTKGESRWTMPGDKATFPKAVYGGNHLSQKPSSRYLENGSYIRLRNVRLSYNLPVTFLDKLNVSSFRIYVSGDNLWTGTHHFVGEDPAVGLSMGPGGSVGYTNAYAISKKILFGINVSF